MNWRLFVEIAPSLGLIAASISLWAAHSRLDRLEARAKTLESKGGGNG